MAYTPPSGDEVIFEFQGGYTPPNGSSVNFTYSTVAVVTINRVSKGKLYDDSLFPGFDSSNIFWQSDLAGPYRVEINGRGAETGTLVSYGYCPADYEMKTIIDDEDIEGATTFSGAGNYRINIYVQNENIGVWTPYNS